MAGSNGDLELANIWFDSAAANDAIMKIVQENLESCAEELAAIIKDQIMSSGHGSTSMKSDAASLVNHVLREASFQKVVYEAGITDEAMGAIAAEDFFVRIMVVLHGNQAHGPIWTKPGGSTFAKGVHGPRPSPAEVLKPLPFFDQPGDRVQAIMDNSIKLIEAVFNACIASIQSEISGDFLTQFLHIG